MADNSLTPKEEFLLNPVAEHNITDAAIASFETNLRHPVKVEVPLKPIQDLHGMDSPYPAGASVNLIPDTTDTSNGYAAGYHLNSDGSTTADANCYISEYIELDSAITYTWSDRSNASITSSICFYDENKNYISGIAINGQYSHTFTPPEGTVYCRSTQTIYEFQEKNPTYPAFQLEVGSTATAYRRYSNICPISGRTGCNITRTGKNVLNPEKFAKNGNFSYNPVTGVFSGRNYPSRFVKLGTFKESTQYTISFKYKGSNASNSTFFYVRYTDGTTSLEKKIASASYVPLVFVTNAGKTVDSLHVSYGTNIAINIADFQVEEGVTASAYEPFGTTFPITFTDPSTGDPLTVYGGTVTLNEDGSVDVISTHCIYDIPSTKWTYSSGATVWYITRASLTPRWDISGDTKDNVKRDIVCSAYKTETYNNAVHPSYAPCIAERRYNANWLAVQTRSADVRPVDCQVKMQLATPITYHFPNVGQLKAFLGTNNVWSDAGNVNVKYLTQNTETGMEYRGDRVLELRRRAMLADAPTIHTTVGSTETNGLASFKSYVKAPVKSVTIPFSPKQDLHGYDHPWPGGGSVNLIPDTTDTSNGYVAGYYLKDDGSTAADAIFYISEYIELDSATTYTWSNRNNAAVNSSICFYDENKNYISGIAINKQYSHTFTPPEGAVYARSSQTTYAWQDVSSASTAFQLEVGSTATAYRRYSNICPIEGWTGCHLSNCDIYHIFEPTSMSPGDIVGPSALIVKYLGNGEFEAIINHSSGSINGTFIPIKPFVAPSSTETRIAFNNDVIVQGGIKIHFTNPSTDDPWKFTEINRVGGYASLRGHTITGFKFYLNAGTTIKRIKFKVEFINTRVQVSQIAFTSPSTGDPMTIYGGTVTLNEDGSADVVAKFSIHSLTKNAVTDGSTAWDYNASGGYRIKFLISQNVVRSGTALCTHMLTTGDGRQVGTKNGRTLMLVNNEDDGLRVYFYISGLNSKSATLNYINEQADLGTPINIIVPLSAANWRTYHFSNLEQLKTFLGENNFWCDISDDITVKYWNRGFGN